MPESFYRWQDQNLFLRIKLQANASKNEICDCIDNRLKIRLRSQPINGQANKHLIAFLAKEFAVRKNEISIISGNCSRQKSVIINSPKQLIKTIKRDPLK